jgi:hypothetical protein
MEFVARSVDSPRGLSQEQALDQLQGHPRFKVGSRIKSIQQKGDRWHIRLLEPKTAEFPPPSDDEDSDGPPAPPSAEEKPESPDSDSDSDSGDSDSDDSGPPSDNGGPPKSDKKSEGGEIKEVLTLLHTLLDALGLSAGPDVGPAGPPAPPPGPPGAGAAPEHGGARPGAGRPPSPAGPAAGPPGGARPARDIPPGANPIAGFASVQDMARQVPEIKVVAADDGTSIKRAKAEIDSIYAPAYKVKQIQRREGKIVGHLSVR